MKVFIEQERSTTRRMVATVLGVWLTILAAPGLASAQTVPDKPQGQGQRPTLINTCLITGDVKGLVSFYESVLQLRASRSGDDYAELRTGVGVLAIFSAQAQDRYIPGSAIAGNNKGVVLEFEVADVDREFRRLHSLVKVWVKPPTTQPWGTRSFYFRDPDGNLVDFYSRPATQ
jgi:catechol 2,3-dioxygenase-like lactoylglutathione lyase family enzyme